MPGQSVKQWKRVMWAIWKELLENDENEYTLPKSLEFVALPPPGQSFDARSSKTKSEIEVVSKY